MSVKYRMGIDSGDDAIVLTDSCVVPILAEAPTAWPPGASGDQFSQTVVVGYRTLGALATFFESGDAPVHITSADAAAFAVGPNGTTNPVFVVDASTASQAAGLKVTGAATGGTVTLAAIDSGADASLGLSAKGTGRILTAFPVTITSASATALAVGLAGATNPAFVVNSSTASQAAGLSVTGAIAAGTVAVAVLSSGADASVTLNAKGTGTIGIGTVSTGAVSIVPILGATLKCFVSTTAAASLNLGNAGTAPSAPNDGDMWIESNTIKVRLNGATVTVTTS